MADREMTQAERTFDVLFHRMRFLDHLLRMSAEPPPGVAAFSWLPSIDEVCKDIAVQISTIPLLEQVRVGVGDKSVVIGPGNVGN